MTRLNVSRSTLLSGVKGVTGTWMIPRGSAAKGLRSDIGSDSSYHFSMQHVLAARASDLIRHRLLVLASSRLERHDLLRLGAQPVDADFDHVAGPQIFRLHLAADADARGRAGGDHVARLQHEELRAIPNDMLAVEDHVAGVAILALLAVDVRPYSEVLRVLDFVLGDEPGPERAEGLGALALGEGLPMLQLERALRHVVAQAIAGDDVHGFFLREITRALADHDDEFALVIELAGVLRDHGVVVRPTDAARRLVEDDRLLRNRVTALGGVIGIIEADREEIVHMADAGAEPRLAGDGFEPLEISLPDLGEAAGGQHGAVDIRHDARQVPYFAVGVDDAGLLAAGRAIADEFHVNSSPSGVCFGVRLKGGSERIMRWRRGRGQGSGRHASSPVFFAAPGTPYFLPAIAGHFFSPSKNARGRSAERRILIQSTPC